MEIKKCSLCGEEKSIKAFGVDISSKDGLSHCCKDCRSKRDRISKSRIISAKDWLKDSKRIMASRRTHHLEASEIAFLYEITPANVTLSVKEYYSIFISYGANITYNQAYCFIRKHLEQVRINRYIKKSSIGCANIRLHNKEANMTRNEIFDTVIHRVLKKIDIANKENMPYDKLIELVKNIKL